MITFAARLSWKYIYLFQDLATDGFDEYGPLVVDTSGHEHDDDDEKDNEDRLDPVVLSSLGESHENIQHQNSETRIRSNGFLDQENKTVLDTITNSDSNLSGSLPPSISPSGDQSPRDSSLIGSSKNHNRRGNKVSYFYIVNYRCEINRCVELFFHMVIDFKLNLCVFSSSWFLFLFHMAHLSVTHVFYFNFLPTSFFFFSPLFQDFFFNQKKHFQNNY